MTDRTDADDDVLQRIDRRASRAPAAVAVRFVLDSTRVETWTWAELHQQYLHAAAALQYHGLGPGDRLLLMLPTSPEYVALLLGAFTLGIVPTTLAPLSAAANNAVWEAEWDSLLAVFAPTALITDQPLPALQVRCLNVAEVLAVPVGAASRAKCPAQRVPAYIQFSSGTTGRAKGIGLSWRAIHANLAAMRAGLPIQPTDRTISWLPMYHDMGLFGMLLAPLYVGSTLVLMDSSLFSRNPLLWFQVMAREGASVTTTPPSALHFCLQLLKRRPQELDLSRITAVICGSEPVSSRLVHEFAEVLGPYGVGAEALKPVYGLAEVTLAVSMPPHRRAPLLDTLGAEGMAQAVADSVTSGAPTREPMVSVGRLLQGFALRIVDDAGESLGERQVGRVLLRSPSLLSGYLDQGRWEPFQEQWLDTGDLGYVANEELYITGRRKDLIIKAGRNYSPEHLEELANRIEGVQRAGAIGVYDQDRITERIVVLVEARARDLSEPAARDRLRLWVRQQLVKAGYPVDEICVLNKGALPRTTSGKIRRQHCRRMYLDGSFDTRSSGEG